MPSSQYSIMMVYICSISILNSDFIVYVLFSLVVAVQFATASNVVSEQAGSVSLCLEKVGEAEVDFEFRLTTLTVTGDSAAEGMRQSIMHTLAN